MAKWGDVDRLLDAKSMIDMQDILKDLIRALRFYAAAGNYMIVEEDTPPAIAVDEGDMARAALRKLGDQG